MDLHQCVNILSVMALHNLVYAHQNVGNKLLELQMQPISKKCNNMMCWEFTHVKVIHMLKALN